MYGYTNIFIPECNKLYRRNNEGCALTIACAIYKFIFPTKIDSKLSLHIHISYLLIFASSKGVYIEM